jgi:basic amino acid/polyamine antiporter, APA family
MQDGSSPLRRELTLTGAIAIVVGTVIGTGIFLKSAVMAQLLGSASLVLAAWIAAGVLSIAGTLTYAELGAMMPHSGGPYVYLRQAYGKLPAFLFGWKELLSTKGASNAAVSVGIVGFLLQLLPAQVVWSQHTYYFLGEPVNWQFGSIQLEAIGFIVVLSAINCVGVVAGGGAQTLLTVLKLIGIAFLIFGAFFFAHGGSVTHFSQSIPIAHPAGVAAFGAAMVAAMWAYSGWGDLSIAAGEVKKPGRTLPLGLIIGILVIIVVYIAANAAYVFALPLHDIATARSTAFPDAAPIGAKVAQAFMGSAGAKFLSLLFIIAALGTLNGGILTGSRIPFAMARDNQFPHAIARVNPRTRTPIVSIALLAVWACLVTLTGTFDQLTTLVIFVDILLDFFGSASIFILRRKMADVVRPYRTPFYPWVPIAYVLSLGWLIINTVQTSPVQAIEGLALLVLGLPVYWYYRRKERSGTEPAAELS